MPVSYHTPAFVLIVRGRMEAGTLGELRTLEGAERALALFFTLVALAILVRVQGLTRVLEGREASTRWASTLRDLANLGALGALVGAFVAAGLPFLAALLAAGSITVLLELFRELSLANEGRRRVGWALGLLLSLTVTLFPGPVLGAMERGLGAIF